MLFKENIEGNQLYNVWGWRQVRGPDVVVTKHLKNLAMRCIDGTSVQVHDVRVLAFPKACPIDARGEDCRPGHVSRI